MNLPTTTPAETLKISPEALEVANAYLTSEDKNLDDIANALDVDRQTVISVLERREVKAYIDNVFYNMGFNNRFRMREAMDALITKKFQELDESDSGSTKDIAELLELSHKMTMAELKMQIEYEKVKANNIKNQVNVQINDSSGSKYDALIQQLLKSGGGK